MRREEDDLETLDEFIEMQQKEKHANSTGGSNAPPLRGVLSNNVISERSDRSPVDPSPDAIEDDGIPVCFITEGENDMNPGYEIIPEALDNVDLSKGLFTRNEGEGGVFREERVQEVL
ncbi:hypothetical protein AAF712_003266 [Marasmius tenuissimus]|uniref:Uncharacterized protein n=1 Tax=Marasmius tenuissimus TaxID=585030 RepID=A0ABR3A7L9_9AGAR